MIHIVHYIGELQYGGSQAFIMELYRRMDRSQIQFDFVTFPDESDKGFASEILSLGGRIFTAPRYNGINHFSFVEWWKNFWTTHPECSIYHVHVHSVASICIPIAHRYNIAAIAHSHTTSNGNDITAPIKSIIQAPVKYQADYLFACSPAAGKWLFGKKIYSNPNYKVIPNTINADRFSFNPETRNRIRKEYQLEKKYVIGHVGRFAPSKNHAFLLNVFAQVLKNNNNAVLMLIGDGPIMKEIEILGKELNISDKILFIGAKHNTQDYYQAMDIFAFPSLWEGFGITLIEAQCSGLKCVVSDTVPQEADLGVGLVEFLPLDNISTWQHSLATASQARYDQSATVRNHGFDSTENARMLQNFYLKVGTSE